MKEEMDNLSEQERLELDNQFLKMKLMLEHNAKIGSCNSKDLPAEIENMFLRNVMEFERQFENCKRIKVYEKIGKPTHFKPAQDLNEKEIDNAWKKLREYLEEHSVYLDVCSPNIPNRELYRFTLEELFDHEVDDIKIPGFGTNFIYDEFHPDPVYECSRVVTDDMFRELFRTEPMYMEYCYAPTNIELNDHVFADFSALKAGVVNFQQSFEEIILHNCDVEKCDVSDKEAVVLGTYSAEGKLSDSNLFFGGLYSVNLVKDEMGYWRICKMRLDNLKI